MNSRISGWVGVRVVLVVAGCLAVAAGGPALGEWSYDPVEWDELEIYKEEIPDPCDANFTFAEPWGEGGAYVQSGLVPQGCDDEEHEDGHWAEAAVMIHGEWELHCEEGDDPGDGTISTWGVRLFGRRSEGEGAVAWVEGGWDAEFDGGEPQSGHYDSCYHYTEQQWPPVQEAGWWSAWEHTHGLYDGNFAGATRVLGCGVEGDEHPVTTVADAYHGSASNWATIDLWPQE